MFKLFTLKNLLLILVISYWYVCVGVGGGGGILVYNTPFLNCKTAHFKIVHPCTVSKSRFRWKGILRIKIAPLPLQLHAQRHYNCTRTTLELHHNDNSLYVCIFAQWPVAGEAGSHTQTVMWSVGMESRPGLGDVTTHILGMVDVNVLEMALRQKPAQSSHV